MRFRRLISTVVASLSALLMMVASPAATSAQIVGDPGRTGKWATPVDIGMAAMHAAVLPNGKVLFYGKVAQDGLGSEAKLFDPANNSFIDVTVPYLHNPFCGGLSFLPDGRLLGSGGEISLVPGGETGEGTDKVSDFDWTTSSWSPLTPMANARWYPSNVAMPDGTTLVFSGRDARGERITQVEEYEPDTDTWTTRPPSADQDLGGLYPRMLLLADGRVFEAGVNKTTLAFDPSTNTWTRIDRFRIGRREAGMSVLLSDLKTVLAAGGSATQTAETIDMSQPAPMWQFTGSLNRMRNHGNLVLLPDGTALAVGGGNDPLPGGPSPEAEVYDPATGTWTLLAPQQYERQYHSTAVLLPDGRVISAGGEGTLGATTVEIYSPPYLFQGPRPKIRSSPASIGYGGTFTVRSRQSSEIDSIVLMRPGATTHGFDESQRILSLDFVVDGQNLSVDEPANSTIAPPGYYMLIILKANGVPSVARFVLVG